MPGVPELLVVAAVTEPNPEGAAPGSKLAVRLTMKNGAHDCLRIRWAESVLVLADGRRFAAVPLIAAESIGVETPPATQSQDSALAGSESQATTGTGSAASTVAMVGADIVGRVADTAWDVVAPLLLIAVVATSPIWIPIVVAIGNKRQAADTTSRDLPLCRGEAVAAVVHFVGGQDSARVSLSATLELPVNGMGRGWLMRVPVESPAR